MIKLIDAYNEVCDKYPEGPTTHPWKMYEYILQKDIYDERSMDICQRYHMAKDAGPWHDTETTLQIKKEFAKKWGIEPEI
ncbi:MAG: hypothetical protein DRG82_15895 [Deltaproteobacteria bacterium]|nr:MAG: hypothetical protein DRG82_15895 [Deltaproteobacteria bacterium]